jgi:hypothetical protein
VLIILGTCVVTPSLANHSVTADEALALGKKLCTPLVDGALTPARWTVYPANAGNNLRDEKGAYWLVDGQYYPKTPQGTISVIDMMVWVPKDGTPPKPCNSVSN